MKAYAQEIQDGLQELIENNTTIAYCAPVISETNTLSTSAGKYEEDRALALNFLGLEDTQAENKEQIDLVPGGIKMMMFSTHKKCGKHVPLQKINNSIICTTKKI